MGDHFTVASIATLGRRKHRWKEISRLFGCVILDEAHRITAPTIYRFLESNAAAYHLGATATPGDKNFRLYSLLGSPRKRIFAQQRNTEHSMALTFVDTVDTNFVYNYDALNLDWHDLSDSILADEGRNAVVVENAYKDWKKGESLIVVTKRVPHVHLLADMLKERGIKGVNVLTGDTNRDTEYTAKLIKATLNRDARCLVATVQAIKLGANLNPASRLHLAMPVANADDLEQLIGRIRRRADKKSDCGLVYYLDNKVSYLWRSVYLYRMIPLFKRLRVKGYREPKTAVGKLLKFNH